jgi:hypothetical protein
VIGWFVVGGAVVFALLVLGFLTYEVTWRARRLQRDVASVADLGPDLAAVQHQLQLLQSRSADPAGDR